MLLEHEKELFVSCFVTVNCIFAYSNFIFSQDAILCFVENYFFRVVTNFTTWTSQIKLINQIKLEFNLQKLWLKIFEGSYKWYWDEGKLKLLAY